MLAMYAPILKLDDPFRIARSLITEFGADLNARDHQGM